MTKIKLDDYNNIYCTKQFEKEWNDLFKNNKKTKEQYDKWLDNKLAKLDQDVSFVSNYDIKTFEPVESSHPKLYSIHSRSKINPRVLYYIVNDKNEAILLTPFIERKKSDYNIAKQRAEARATQYIKERLL